jgi:hypothetical protein
VLHLDHVSLLVPGDPSEACAGWGLRWEHGRVLLDRRYLEVRRGDRLAAIGLFLAGDDPHAPLGPPSLYEGADGTWEDRTLAVPDGSVTVAVVRRLTPPDVARDWPPPLAEPHPCGATTLDAVVVCGDAGPLRHVEGVEIADDAGPVRIVAVRLGPGGPTLRFDAR